LEVIVVEGLALVSLLGEEQESGHPRHLFVLEEEADVQSTDLLYPFDMELVEI
jgi:hypothetical protein